MSGESATPKRDWSAYNKALIERGSLTVWIDEDALARWAAPENPFKRGRPFVFGDIAIQFLLTLREAYRLPLRAGPTRYRLPRRLGVLWRFGKVCLSGPSSPNKMPSRTNTRPRTATRL